MELLSGFLRPGIAVVAKGGGAFLLSLKFAGRRPGSAPEGCLSRMQELALCEFGFESGIVLGGANESVFCFESSAETE